VHSITEVPLWEPAVYRFWSLLDELALVPRLWCMLLLLQHDVLHSMLADRVLRLVTGAALVCTGRGQVCLLGLRQM
jgi:hypothetical protein